MPTNCTCGAPLPENARFCHRCGKPQWEEDVAKVEPELPAARVVPPPLAATAAVTFNNPLALRTSILVASLTTILEIVPFMILVAPIFGGYASVALYQRRTNQILSTGSAAKLGWMTAIINALLLTIFMVLNFLVEGGAIVDALRDSLKHQMTTPPQQEALRMLNDPWMLGVTAMLAWIMFFVFTSLLYMAGSALGAKFSRQRTS